MTEKVPYKKPRIKVIDTRKKYKCPNIDELLPDFSSEFENDNFFEVIHERFNHFFINYIDTRTKEFFIKLPPEFFTKENAKRINDYAKLVFNQKIDDCENGVDVLNLSTSKEFYENMYKTLIRRLNQRVKEYKKMYKSAITK